MLRLSAFREKLFDALDGLLGTVINPQTNATLRDELQEAGTSALDYLKEHLRKKGLENERIEAETVHILEKVREIRARTEADIRKSAAETEKINLEILDKKIAIVEKLLQMAERMEPNAVVNLLTGFVPAEQKPLPLRQNLISRGKHPA